MKFVKSKDNPIVKHIHKLVGQKKYRAKCGQFVAEGLRTCRDILISDVKVDIFLCSERFYTHDFDLCSQLEAISEESLVVPEKIFSILSDTKSPQGVMLVVKTLDKKIDIDKMDYSGKYLLLENIQNPENIATMLRSAEAFSIDGILLTEDCCDIYSPKVVRGSMGAIFRVPFYSVSSSADFLNNVYKYRGISYAACLKDDSKKLSDISFDKNSLVVIGNEANGISNATIEACDYKVIIPMRGRIDSLNAGVAASIILWEMTKNG